MSVVTSVRLSPPVCSTSALIGVIAASPSQSPANLAAVVAGGVIAVTPPARKKSLNYAYLIT